MLVIEAKVDAFESDRQLHIYDKWFANIPKETTRVDRVFLTPDGRTPNTSKERWAALSFLQVACAFRRAYPKLKSTPGYDFLRYYISGVLKDICGLSLPMIDAAKHADPYSCKKYLQSVRASNGESL